MQVQILFISFALALCSFCAAQQVVDGPAPPVDGPTPPVDGPGSGDGPAPPTFPPLTRGLPFQEPPYYSSDSDDLDITLAVDMGTVTLDWLNVMRRLYNDLYPAPTIKVRPGQRLNIRLVNNLQHPDFTAPESRHLPLHQPNTTNLHLHGLHISPLEPQDNPFIAVNPGEEYSYYYEIDENQPTGTFWYHPHHHGSVAFQTESGMHGMLIVEDEQDSDISGFDDVQIVFSQFRYSEPGGFITLQDTVQDDPAHRLDPATEGWLRNPRNGISHMLVNGMLQPTLDIEAGVVKRFRMVNTAGLFLLGVSIEGENGTSCEFLEIAVDGVYLQEPREPFLGRSLMLSGSRIDWLVKCPSPGTYQLTAKGTFADGKTTGLFPPFYSQPGPPFFREQSTPLLTIEVHGNQGENDEIEEIELPEVEIYQDLRDIPDDEIDGRFAIEITPTSTLNREDYSGGDYWRYKAEVDTVQEIIFTNPEWAMSHPMHMHVNKMQVVSYNQYTGPVAIDDGDFYDGDWTLFSQEGEVCQYQHKYYNASSGVDFSPVGPPPTFLPYSPLHFIGHDDPYHRNDTIGYNQVGDWVDVIQVPPLANITVRFRTRRYTGPVAVHCHTTVHEDKGMMLVFGIVEQGEDLTANVTHEGIYPWACNENIPNSLPIVKEDPEPEVDNSTSTLAVVVTLSVSLAFLSCALAVSRLGRGGV